MDTVYKLGLEFLIIVSGTMCFFTKYKGILMAILTLSLVNWFHQGGEGFWRWELSIFLTVIILMSLIIYLDHLSNLTYTINLYLGGMSLITVYCIFIAVLPAIILWILFFGIPVLFTARHVSKRWLYLTVCLRTMLPVTVIIIGNYLL